LYNIACIWNTLVLDWLDNGIISDWHTFFMAAEVGWRWSGHRPCSYRHVVDLVHHQAEVTKPPKIYADQRPVSRATWGTLPYPGRYTLGYPYSLPIGFMFYSNLIIQLTRRLSKGQNLPRKQAQSQGWIRRYGILSTIC